MLFLSKSPTWCEVFDETGFRLLGFSYQGSWHVILKTSLRAHGFDAVKLTLKSSNNGVSLWELKVNPYEKPPVELLDDRYEIEWKCHTCSDEGGCPFCGGDVCPTCGEPPPKFLKFRCVWGVFARPMRQPCRKNFAPLRANLEPARQASPSMGCRGHAPHGLVGASRNAAGDAQVFAAGCRDARRKNAPCGRNVEGVVASFQPLNRKPAELLRLFN